MAVLKFRAIANFLGVRLPKALVEQPGMKKRHFLHLSTSPDAYRLIPHSSHVKKQMRLAESVMQRYRDALRRLGE